MRKTHTATISLPPQLAKRVRQIGVQRGFTRSELFREALRRYIAEEEEEQALMQYLQVRAKRMGIKTEDDVARMVDDART